MYAIAHVTGCAGPCAPVQYLRKYCTLILYSTGKRHYKCTCFALRLGR